MKRLLLGESPQALAEETGISPRNLKYWKAQAKAALVQESAPETAKKDVLELLSRGRLAYLEHLLDPAVVQKESGYYSSQAFKHLNDAYQLLTGQATGRLEMTDLASFLKSSTDSGTRTDPTPLRVLRSDKAG
jgi:hypothetical protein